MTLSSISVSRVQPLAPPSPTLKHACLLCTFGYVSTAFPSIQTNQKPYSLAHINGFKLSLPHPLSTYLTPWLSFLIKSPVSVWSWIQISLSMLTSPRCAKKVIFISDGDGVSLKTPRPRGWVGAGRPSGCKSSFNKRNMYQYPHVSQLFILTSLAKPGIPGAIKSG